MEKQILTSEALGKVIKEARKDQNLTQAELAGISGTGSRLISDLERGKKTAEIGRVLLVLGVLGISLYALSKWKK